MQNMILEVVSTLAVAVVTGAITVLVSFLQSKIKSDRINSSLSRVESLTNATVHQIQQEVVNEWKGNGNKKLPPEIVRDIKVFANARIKDLLDDPAAKLLESVGIELDKLIETMVEKAVLAMKQDSIELVADGIRVG